MLTVLVYNIQNKNTFFFSIIYKISKVVYKINRKKDKKPTKHKDSIQILATDNETLC